MFPPVDSAAVDFKGIWWLLLFPGGFCSLLGWLTMALLKQRGPYQLIAF